MKLDRKFQKEVMLALADIYPRLGHAEHVGNVPEDVRATNLFYLADHGLITTCVSFYLDNTVRYQPTRITKDGMDFLASDGGLSAVLGVVTVKFHEHTLLELIGRRIETSDLAQTDKKRLLDQLRGLRGETIKHLTLKLVDAGLANWPAALQAIETFLVRPAH
ncbi:DUF2513 domain-containing protein [Caballeronia sp. GaOx3]|uniref:DUF2513 domain-containing protein n=1 Tax=Caballeronia sp. GaOx3 TaxID=2921740 RepID=UPI002028FF5D|nr:DUF2513 domain-containing protein [Caballeronia sp. GaOx3]